MAILTKAQIDIAVTFWTIMFKRNNKREEFSMALREILEEVSENELRTIFQQELQVDYDPSPLLIRALTKIGIECRGSFFSAKDIFPYKTRSYLNKDGTVGISMGYGDGPQEIRTMEQLNRILPKENTK